MFLPSKLFLIETKRSFSFKTDPLFEKIKEVNRLSF
jgi:hypothetical protein